MGDRFVRRIVWAGVWLGVFSASVVRAQTVATGARTVETARMASVTVNVENAELATVLRMIAQQAGLRLVVPGEGVPTTLRVSVHVHDIVVSEAFAKALAGTRLKAIIGSGNAVLVRTDRAGEWVARGGITGTVVDRKTKLPLHGVTVTLDASTKGVLSGDDGTFRIANVGAGEHLIRVRLLGYVKTETRVTVLDGQTASVALTLERSVSTLDQVVVTGTVTPTELKAIPNAITVITAKDIEQRGITHIDQLFRGDVPGLFAQNQGTSLHATLGEVIMFSRGATSLSNYSAGVSVGTLTNPIKTYLDGVELADPKYLSQIDPKSIDRIEILTGPQASTIYGSNAINGVMQIFTKRGTTARPAITATFLSGWVQNDFSSAWTPQHDDAVQINGVEGRLSYNAGGSWNYLGPWTPAQQMTRTSVYGGTRLELPTPVGRITADATLRRGVTENRQNGGAASQLITHFQDEGWGVPRYRYGGENIPTTATLHGQTLGLSVGYVPTSWWSHTLDIGQDDSDAETLATAPGHTAISDTLLSLLQTGSSRRSLRYSTTANISVSARVKGTITVGADAWQNTTSLLSVQTPTLTGTLTYSGTPTIKRQPGHNTGGFVQAQLGLSDQLFVTYGLRAEWNPNFGDVAQPNYAPRYGVAYTRDYGPVTAKLRASYGRATRPPQTTYASEMRYQEYFGPASTVVAAYGDAIYQIGNPDLGPEHQQGGEGGVELYWGTRASLVITRYNQTIDGLITNISPIDSARSLFPTTLANSVGADGYGYLYQNEFLNVGSIRNQGWELQGSMNAGPLTARGTYSWTKSRTLGIDPRYRALINPLAFPQYQPGATFQYLPEHTWAAGVTYAHAGTSIALNVTGVGRETIMADAFYLTYINGPIRLQSNRLCVTCAVWPSANNGYALADLTATQRWSAHVEGVLQMQNVGNWYANDYSAQYATLGRQTKLGIRIR